MDILTHGFKVFNPNWTCRGKQYSCPGIFEEEGEIAVCDHGMHFCLNLADCFNYYQFDHENHVAEVIAHGQVARKDDKCCTNKLEIVRELSWQEVLERVNTGKNCTGRCNTGDWNTGNRNTGNRNTGNCNTGDWNRSSFNSGCFMTEEQKIMLFNKTSDWTYRDWLNSDARHLLNRIPKKAVEWIYSGDMTDEEKEAYPAHDTTDGYLKVLDESESAQIWWDGLSREERNIIMSLPNFDPEIFEQCTGIRI